MIRGKPADARAESTHGGWRPAKKKQGVDEVAKHPLKFSMRWVMAVGWLLASGILRADVTWDLDLPFVQTALIQEKTGEVTEKAVRKGRVNGADLEMQKEEGGLLVLPRERVLALLPRLPQAGTPYLQSDAQRALRILQELQDKFAQRPEASREALAKWQALAATPTSHDQTESAALDAWLEKSSRLSSDATPEEIEKIKEEGETFLRKFPERAKEIEREFKGLKELGGMDLKKMDSIQFELGPLGDNLMPGMVLWALLTLPLAVALKAFAEAPRGFREGVPLAGGLRLLIGGVALAFLVLILLPEKEEGAKAVTQENIASVAARKAAWFSLNHQEKWSNQGAKKIPLSAADWLAFLEEKVVVGSGADVFPFWYLAKPEIFTTEASLVWVQPLQAKFVSLPFHFIFARPRPGQSLTETELSGASLGMLPLGATLGQFVWRLLEPSYRPITERCGIGQGVRWLAGEGGTLIVEVPPTEKPRPKAKESISAKELAEVFEEGFGGIYEGKVINVEGDLVGVSSIRETLGEGTKLDKQDPMDEFTLEGLPEGPGRQYALRIRCQFKSSDSYFLDPKGDLFKAAPLAQNPAADIPILRRQNGSTKIRIRAGRVESKPTETRLITLYDCRKVEGFDGKEWVAIWEN